MRAAVQGLRGKAPPGHGAMSHRLACILALALAVAGLPDDARAQQAADDAGTMLGSGTSWTCRQWSQARQDDPMHDPEPAAWVLGFLSGVAAWSDPQHQGVGRDPLRGIRPDAVLSWVDRWCHTNPSHPVFAAASSFVRANSHAGR